MHFKSIYLILFLALVLFSQCHTTSKSTAAMKEPIFFSFTGTSIRAIKAIDEKEVHFAGSDGSYGFTTDQGKSWNIDSIKIDGKGVHFRGIEITDRGTFLMGISSPAYLIHIPKGSKEWQIIYQEDHEKAFYDAIQIKDKLGVMMGDPTDECLSIVLSHDGGKTWKKVACDQLPKIEEGVAAFAASNSNISIQGDNIWLVTGGKKALVYHSPDAGKTWSVHPTPIAQGEQMTGIFACDFKDDQKGVIVGGNWDQKSQNTASIALTKDGGKTWYIPKSGQQVGYSSDVQFLPYQKNSLISASSEHLMISRDMGKTWHKINELKPYAVQMISNDQGWAAGNEFIAFFEVSY